MSGDDGSKVPPGYATTDGRGASKELLEGFTREHGTTPAGRPLSESDPAPELEKPTEKELSDAQSRARMAEIMAQPWTGRRTDRKRPGWGSCF